MNTKYVTVGLRLSVETQRYMTILLLAMGFTFSIETFLEIDILLFIFYFMNITWWLYNILILYL